MLESCTNYECQKGLYSSFNDLNLFEINYSLNRQFGAGGITFLPDGRVDMKACSWEVSQENEL